MGISNGSVWRVSRGFPEGFRRVSEGFPGGSEGCAIIFHSFLLSGLLFASLRSFSVRARARARGGAGAAARSRARARAERARVSACKRAQARKRAREQFPIIVRFSSGTGSFLVMFFVLDFGPRNAAAKSNHQYETV